MTLRFLISLSLLLAWQKVCAQLAPADDFFNSGAQFYISNNIPAALERVELGLKTYPDDVKLKKLEELLKQRQQSQSQQNQQQQNQQNQQSQSNQQQKNQQNQQQNSSNQQNQSQQNQQQEQQQKQQPQQKSGEKQSGEKQENQNEQGQPVSAGQMTPEEAKRLLDAQKGNEQVLQLKPQGKAQNQNQPIKDW